MALRKTKGVDAIFEGLSAEGERAVRRRLASALFSLETGSGRRRADAIFEAT